jgi:hypothetical protein
MWRALVHEGLDLPAARGVDSLNDGKALGKIQIEPRVAEGRRVFMKGKPTLRAVLTPIATVEDCCIADARQHLFQGCGIAVVRFLFGFDWMPAPLTANHGEHVQDSG